MSASPPVTHPERPVRFSDCFFPPASLLPTNTCLAAPKRSPEDPRVEGSLGAPLEQLLGRRPTKTKGKATSPVSSVTLNVEHCPT